MTAGFEYPMVVMCMLNYPHCPRDRYRHNRYTMGVLVCLPTFVDTHKAGRDYVLEITSVIDSIDHWYVGSKRMVTECNGIRAA